MGIFRNRPGSARRLTRIGLRASSPAVGFNVIPNGQPAHVGSSFESRNPILNLAAPRRVKSHHWFSDNSLTKADTRNFANP